MGTEDGNTPAWMEQLTDDLKGNEALTQFENLSDLGKSFVDLHGKSANAIQLPGEEATDEERGAFFNSLGRPETPDGYKVERPQMPEGLIYDEEGEGKLKSTLHDIGLTGDQFGKVYKAYNANAIEAYTEIQKERAARHDRAVEALQQKWGDKYEGNAKMAMGFVEKTDPKFAKYLEASGWGDNPPMIEFFHTLAMKIDDDKMLLGGPGGGGGEGDDADAIYPEMAAKTKNS